MSKKYCPSCGKEAHLSQNFCGTCGSSLNSLSPKPIQTKSSVTTTFTPFVVNADDDDIEDVDKLTRLDIKINKLELDIRQYQNKETVGTVFSQGKSSEPGTIRQANYSNTDSAKFLEEFQTEASSKPWTPLEK